MRLTFDWFGYVLAANLAAVINSAVFHGSYTETFVVGMLSAILLVGTRIERAVSQEHKDDKL